MNDRKKGGEVETETGERLKGPKPLNVPAEKQQTQGGAPNRKQQGGQHASEGRQQGDDRTPDKPIGEVAYANRDPAKKKTGEF
jgi:hypothetical protein